ncbi:MAG: hypothetical protein J5I50_06465 [Chitinophagaceae bacterium]|nr:hypothetical protein [Chitinophagaceae bacterium]
MSKFLVPLFFFVILLAGCRSSDSSGAEEVDTDTILQQDFDTLDLSKTIVNIPSLWKIKTEDNGREEKLEAPENDQLSSLSATELADALNESYPDIQLSFVKISKDTIYLAIPESQFLTQQTGSTGAFNYMATVVYNFTELKNIKYVNFNFQEGDHAVPGTYSREDFKRLR